MRRTATSLRWLLILVGPAFAQPTWTPTGSMNAPHTQHPATLLPNGKVLVVGTLACNPNCYSGFSGELYDPATDAWSMISPPRIARFNHVAELVPNGKVLVAGGYLTPGILTGSSELYDPAIGAWTSTGSLATPRQFHASALLSGGKVLVTGGLGMDGQGSFLVLSSAEVYDPATGRWTPAGSMSVPRWEHTMTTLSDGRVLVVGGTSSDGSSLPALQSAELYDPVSGTWTRTPDLGAARESHAATLLPNGQVLVTGGSGVSDCLASAELYDPVGGHWNPTGDMTGPRRFHSLTVLPSGWVLAAAGGDCTMVLSTSEIYDPSAGKWSQAADLTQVRRYHSATLLQSGKVLIAGGDDGTSGIQKGLTTSELFGVSGSSKAGTINVSAASFVDNGAVAAESLATTFGSNLASTTQTAQGSALPTTLAGVSVSVQDSAATVRQALMLAVSPGQVNYQVPSGTALGTAKVTINRGGIAVASGNVLITQIAPGIFSADGSGRGLAAALVERIKADGSQGYEQVVQFDSSQQRFAALPIDLGPSTDQVFLLLYGTGIRFRSTLTAVSATIGAATVVATFAGPSPQFPGLDQVNLPLPLSLAGSGEIQVSLNVDGLAANSVLLSIK